MVYFSTITDDDRYLHGNVMIALTNRGVKCLLSNSDTDYVRELYNYDFFEIIPVQAKRAINSNSEGRGSVNEVLVKNWKD